MGVAAFLSALAVQAAAPAAAPPGADNLPAQAVDHIVVMEDRRADCATCASYRRTITRSGSWAKDEHAYADHSETIYSDFASGTSFTLRRNRAGVLERLLIERDFETRGRSGMRRARTDRRDTLLGETCEIWTVTSRLLSTETETCETADGIMLWRRFLDRVSPRAVSVERRAVRPEEVRPPAGLFAEAPWPTLDRRSAAGAVGYEVQLAVGRDDMTALRGQGGNVSGWSRDPRDGLSVWGTGGDRRFSYRADAKGRPVRLEVDLHGDRGYVARWEAVAGRPPRRVLGESCIWQDDANTWSSDESFDCRTADGIPLLLETSWHWTGETEIKRARSLARRPLTDADMAPPPGTRDWASWGVTPPGP
jgi:hypothetical protein